MDSYVSYYSTSLGISIKGINSNKLRKYSTNIRRKNKGYSDGKRCIIT